MSEANVRFEEFDDWAELARTDPNAFEARRRAVIDEFIDSVPERNRHHLRCLQWRVDMERKRASTPLAACYQIYRMMWQSFAGERGLMSALRDADQLCREGSSPGMPQADILAFRPAGSQRHH